MLPISWWPLFLRVLYVQTTKENHSIWNSRPSKFLQAWLMLVIVKTTLVWEDFRFVRIFSWILRNNMTIFPHQLSWPCFYNMFVFICFVKDCKDLTETNGLKNIFYEGGTLCVFEAFPGTLQRCFWQPKNLCHFYSF